MAEGVGDLVGAEAGVDGDGDGAEGADGEEERHPAEAVGPAQADVLAVLDAEGGEGAADLGDFGGELGVGEAAAGRRWLRRRGR